MTTNHPESQDTTFRNFAYGFSVAVHHRDGRVYVTISDHDGDPYYINDLPFDQWTELNDFVRDATRRYQEKDGKHWDGVTVKDVAIDILETYEEHIRCLKGTGDDEPTHPNVVDFRKRLEEADLATFTKALEPLKEAADDRARLVAYALLGVLNAFENPVTAVDPPEADNEVLLVAYRDGVDLGRELSRKIPESERLINSFIDSLTHTAFPLWEAHHGVQLDDEDVIEFARTMHGLFNKFSKKDRSKAADNAIEQVHKALSVADMVAVLVDRNRKKKAQDAAKQPDAAGGQPSVVPDM